MSFRGLLLAIGVTALLSSGGALRAEDPASRPSESVTSHGLSAYGDLKYAADFRHFDYVDPSAPKGGAVGTMDWAGISTFDSLNAFILKGQYAAGLENRAEYRSLLFDSLMIPSRDEPDSFYGLLAETVEYPADRRWLLFTLRESARFHDGSPVSAADVAFSIQSLRDRGHPIYRLALRDVAAVEALDARRLKVSFAEGARTRSLSLFVASMPVFSAAYYANRDFQSTTLEPPLGSGPYRVLKIDPGRSIAFQRIPDYWAKDLPARRGTYNFDTVTFQYFRDRQIALEAFKAGLYDFREEFTAKVWATEYTGPRIDKGVIRRDEIADRAPAGLQAFFINTRRAKFADPRVREALDFAFDFEWINKTMFHGAYVRNRSVFERTDLAHRGRPRGAERALLEPYRDRLPEAAFGEAYRPPKTDGSGNNRGNLRHAMALLGEAGFRMKGGRLLGPDGQPLEIQFLADDATFVRILTPYVESLRQIGVQAAIRRVDGPEYEARAKAFDFDILMRAFAGSATPGIELRDSWGSANANAEGTFNYAGVASAAVDALIEKVIAADDRAELTIAARALDRAIMHGHYVVPAWRNDTHRVAYRDRFGQPQTAPLYSLGFLETWWIDPEKEALTKAREEGLK